MARRDRRRIVERLPLRRGALNGAVVWLTGAGIVTFLAAMGGPGVATVSIGILGYYVIHLWPLLFGSEGVTLLVLGSLIPVVGLTFAGYSVATETDGGFEAGASVVAGYFPLAVLSLVVVFVQLSGIASAFGGSLPVTAGTTLQALVALLCTGVVMPVVFGGIGGLIAN